MDIDKNKKRLFVKDGKEETRPRKPNSLSMISPIDNFTDIGRTAFRMKEIYQIFKNRYKVMEETYFEDGDSVLKTLINPQKEEFKYYNYKTIRLRQYEEWLEARSGSTIK